MKVSLHVALHVVLLGLVNQTTTTLEVLLLKNLIDYMQECCQNSCHNVIFPKFMQSCSYSGAGMAFTQLHLPNFLGYVLLLQLQHSKFGGSSMICSYRSAETLQNQLSTISWDDGHIWLMGTIAPTNVPGRTVIFG